MWVSLSTVDSMKINLVDSFACVGEARVGLHRCKPPPGNKFEAGSGNNEVTWCWRWLDWYRLQREADR
uniref:Uncharacterized protein n=1 Tax=Manihot esculenta TaxID=3983 RepID=A0A2C9UEE6_MANES